MSEYDDALNDYNEKLDVFVDELSTQVSFGLITSEDPEGERKCMRDVGLALAGLANQYEDLGMANLQGAFIIDDLAARAIAIFKALGEDV